MKTSKKLDMTQGPVMKLVLLFALPLCFGNILQQLYNTVDTMVIGQFCLPVSLAAVGTSSQPLEIFLCLFLGLGSGVSILVAQYTGSGDIAALKRTVSTASSFLYLCAVPLTLLGILFGPFVLKLMKVPDDALELSSVYLRILFLGSLGNMGYNMNAGILRGLGDSRATLRFLVISCAVNIVLDLLFVAVLKLDVAGAALATILAMYCSWIFSILFIKKKYPDLNYTVLPRRIDRDVLLSIVKVGLPLGFNTSIYSVGHIMLQTLINAQGSVFMAGCSVATKVIGIASVAVSSFSSAATTFAGQNLGAKNYMRLKKGGRTIPFFSGLVTFFFVCVFFIFCRPVLRLFTPDADVLDMAVRYVKIVLPSHCLYAVFNGIINFVNGMGQVRYSIIVNILTLWAVRIPSAHLIDRFADGTYVMVCYPISFAFGLVCMLAFYLSGRWREVKRLAAEQEKKGGQEPVTLF